MKKTFLTNMLPMIAAAIILATSCSKDNDSDNKVVPTPDNTVPVQEQVAEDNQVKTIPFSITVGRDANTLSKATVDEGTLTQKFEAGDLLVISGENISGALTLKSGVGEATATFEGTLSGDGVASITDDTPLTVKLTNEENGNTGAALTEVQSAESLAEAFQKYGYWTASFTYGVHNNVELVQNTAFVKVDLPFHGTKLNVKIGGTTTPIYLNGDEILAVPDGATLTSPLLDIDKTVDVSDGKVVLNIKNRTTPTDCIAGVFSVSESKQIFFSKGNLRYNADNTPQWSFAANQWDNIGDRDGNVFSATSGTRDRFGWGMWLEGGNPMNNSLSASDYSWDATKKAVIGDDWQTLCSSEWDYLSNRESQSKYGLGTIHDYHGMILLPDSWTLPDGLSFTPGKSDWVNTYSDEEWSQMETAGAVFLPASGNRYGTASDRRDTENKYGNYWSWSYGEDVVKCGRVFFYSNSVDFLNGENQIAHDVVRLVRGL